jgi:hypothetical protein
MALRRIPFAHMPETRRASKSKSKSAPASSPSFPCIRCRSFSRNISKLQQEYFKELPFKPADIPCLAHEEVISEKIRAAAQRSKIRDLHDLSQTVNVKFDRELSRSLAVIKLWESDKDNLDYGHFTSQVEGGKDYDLNELKNLLRKDEQPNLQVMIKRVIDNYRWLGQLTDLEREITRDAKRTRKNAVATLKAEAVKRAGG